MTTNHDVRAKHANRDPETSISRWAPSPAPPVTRSGSSRDPRDPRVDDPPYRAHGPTMRHHRL